MNTKAWLNLYLAPLLLYSYGHEVRGRSSKVLLFNILNLDCESFISGTVTLSPSEIAQVCVGNNLEFTCNITGRVLEWHFPLIMDSFRPFTHGIAASGSAEAQTLRVLDNSTTYILTRSSSENSPVSSKLQISTVRDSHNGTIVTCLDVNSATESSTTIVTTVTDDQVQGVCMYSYYNKTPDPIDYLCWYNYCNSYTLYIFSMCRLSRSKHIRAI